MVINVLTADDWRDYELMDSGNGEKLERWGQYLTIRPEPRAIWNKAAPELWKKPGAVFVQNEDRGEWKFKDAPPEPWIISYKEIKFKLKTTDFRHMGVFPEQAPNWDWISENIRSFSNHQPGKDIKILNLFAYTGGATMAAGLAGAHITHTDASRPAMMWASENLKYTKVAPNRIRWIQDDAMKFVNREIRRGERYDGIVMDPPKFGRGVRGEVWKLLENLPEMVSACRQIMTANPLFFLINAYAADVSSAALFNLLTETMRNQPGSAEAGELGLRESAGGRILPAGIFARWSTGEQ